MYSKLRLPGSGGKQFHLFRGGGIDERARTDSSPSPEQNPPRRSRAPWDRQTGAR